MKHNWFQFRLRTLFALLTLAAVVTGIVQHVRHLNQRLQRHRAKLEMCESRRDELTTQILLASLSLFDSLDDSSEVESNDASQGPENLNSSASESERQLPQGHLLHFGLGPSVGFKLASAEARKSRVQKCEQEIAAHEKAISHHQRQIKLYKKAIWQPWMKVTEDPSQELSDLPPETAPPLVPQIPQLPPPVDDQPRTPSLQLESPPPATELPPKARHPWQPIERPLPHDFDERDVQVKKAADA